MPCSNIISVIITMSAKAIALRHSPYNNIKFSRLTSQMSSHAAAAVAKHLLPSSAAPIASMPCSNVWNIFSRMQVHMSSHAAAVVATQAAQQRSAYRQHTLHQRKGQLAAMNEHSVSDHA
jgi:hypothetical protein